MYEPLVTTRQVPYLHTIRRFAECQGTLGFLVSYRLRGNVLLKYDTDKNVPTLKFGHCPCF